MQLNELVLLRVINSTILQFSYESVQIHNYGTKVNIFRV